MFAGRGDSDPTQTRGTEASQGGVALPATLSPGQQLSPGTLIWLLSHSTLVGLQQPQNAESTGPRDPCEDGDGVSHDRGVVVADVRFLNTSAFINSVQPPSTLTGKYHFLSPCLREESTKLSQRTTAV